MNLVTQYQTMRLEVISFFTHIYICLSIFVKLNWMINPDNLSLQFPPRLQVINFTNKYPYMYMCVLCIVVRFP